jgi:hypothetical protein
MLLIMVCEVLDINPRSFAIVFDVGNIEQRAICHRQKFPALRLKVELLFALQEP